MFNTKNCILVFIVNNMKAIYKIWCKANSSIISSNSKQRKMSNSKRDIYIPLSHFSHICNISFKLSSTTLRATAILHHRNINYSFVEHISHIRDLYLIIEVNCLFTCRIFNKRNVFSTYLLGTVNDEILKIRIVFSSFLSKIIQVLIN